MVHTPETVSYPFPDSPTTPAALIKDEPRRPSLGAVSAAPSTEHEASAQARKGAKKPRSVVNMTQEQRNRKRENGKIPLLSRSCGYATPCLRRVLERPGSSLLNICPRVADLRSPSSAY